MFLRYESFREYIRFYPVNTIILAICVAAHVGFAVAASAYGVPASILKQIFGGFLKIPAEGVVPEYWRYVSSAFLHADFGHLLFNGFAIFVFAPPLERALGPMRYAVLFLFSAVMGNIFTNLYAGEVFSLGASGAVYGIFGAYVYYMIFHRRAMDPQSKKTIQTILIVGVVYSIVVPHVNLYAHLGGFVGGLLLNGLYTKVLQGRYR
ncbi:rhomboid family intramembrane serine protease [Paenibacillus sp.]|uniref:rhomboid family intramembrane serine protease n=1 Tax=Paenibacillus sp. TaxID=58172 RepID=UPI0028111662|nr:rhomboid family intramembrane serine protease [Paenibacillus sp.]